MAPPTSSGIGTLVIGLDGACESVLDPLVAAGEAPTLGRLFEAGAAGPLDSHVPPWTPAAWPTLFTGVTPGEHGVFGSLTFDGYDRNVVDRPASASTPSGSCSTGTASPASW